MAEPSKSRPTISEVARAAGVGRSSAARALGSYGSVSESTRRKVLKKARELGYVTNELARSMSTGTTKSLGVILADIANPFFSQVMRGVADAATAQGYDILIANTDEDVDSENAAVRTLLNKQVDGVLLAPAGAACGTADHLEILGEHDVPVVQFDRVLESFASDAVVIGNAQSAEHAVNQLIAAGHRRIGLAWGPRAEAVLPSVDVLRELVPGEISSTGERVRGYMRALEIAGIDLDPQLVMHHDQTANGVTEFVRERLTDGSGMTACLLTESDGVIGALRALRQLGMHCPKDLSLVAFDNAPWTEVVTPALSVVEQPTREMGKIATRMLIERIKDRSRATQFVCLDAVYAERDSVGVLSGSLPAGAGNQ